MNKILLVVVIWIQLSFLCLVRCDDGVTAEETTSTTTEVIDYSCIRAYGSPAVIPGECKPAEECTGGIFRGTCQDARLSCCYNDPRSPPASSTITYPVLTRTLFLDLFGNTTRNRLMYEWFAESLDLAGINPNNPHQIAAYLSQIADESSSFLRFESGLLDRDDYELIGNTLEQDGVFFQGRGGIYVRGRSYYFAANQVLGPSNKQIKPFFKN